jgi:hypothetical protein
MDDVVVKTRNSNTLIADLDDTFHPYESTLEAQPEQVRLLRTVG